jgi:hypothetical protein
MKRPVCSHRQHLYTNIIYFFKSTNTFQRLPVRHFQYFSITGLFNPLNAELNPICHLLALLGAYHILHVSRIRVKL